jgi:hypothetical protein
VLASYWFFFHIHQVSWFFENKNLVAVRLSISILKNSIPIRLSIFWGSYHWLCINVGYQITNW